MTGLDVLAYSIGVFCPLIALALMCKWAEMQAKRIFTAHEYALYMANVDVS